MYYETFIGLINFFLPIRDPGPQALQMILSLVQRELLRFHEFSLTKITKVERLLYKPVSCAFKVFLSVN